MHPRRLTRLNELIQQTISQLALNLKDPDIGFITITGAETTNDVTLTKVYYSVLGTPKEIKATAQALERAKSHIRREVGQLENLRRVPQIQFYYDDSVEKADRINRLMHVIEEEVKPEEAKPTEDIQEDEKPDESSHPAD